MGRAAVLLAQKAAESWSAPGQAGGADWVCGGFSDFPCHHALAVQGNVSGKIQPHPGLPLLSCTILFSCFALSMPPTAWGENQRC